MNLVYNFNSNLSIYTEIFLLIIILVFILFYAIVDHAANYKFILIKHCSKFLILALLLSLIIMLNSTDSNFIYFNFLLVFDEFTYFVKFFIIISFIICILMSINYFKFEGINNYEYFILLLLNVIGILNIICCYNFISMYLAIELQSLCFYIMASFKSNNNYSLEAGVKYFILGAFSSGLLLFGCCLIYGFTGLINFYDLSLFFNKNNIEYIHFNGLSIGIIFISVGLLFKNSSSSLSHVSTRCLWRYTYNINSNIRYNTKNSYFYIIFKIKCKFIIKRFFKLRWINII